MPVLEPGTIARYGLVEAALKMPAQPRLACGLTRTGSEHDDANRRSASAGKSPFMRSIRAFLIAISTLVVFALQTHATKAAETVRAEIYLSEQRLYLYVDGELEARWPVSTARRGFRTPTGSFRPSRLERMWHSRKYDWAPMPYSIFFRGGYAIHGTTEIKRLGRPVSHGCVRLHPDNARLLFNLVREAGRPNSRIVIRP